jgi:DNA replication protein DnaC
VPLRTPQRGGSKRPDRSLLLTTNQTVTQWGHVFGDDMIAAAVLDRVLHHSHVLLIQGDSFRLKQKKRAGLLGSSKSNPRSFERG